MMSEQLQLSLQEQTTQQRNQERVRDAIDELQDVKDPSKYIPAFNQALDEAGYSVRLADFKNPTKIPRSDGSESEGILATPGITEEGDVFVTARIYEEGQKVGDKAIEKRILLEDIENYNQTQPPQSLDSTESKEGRSPEWKRQQAKATQRKGRGQQSLQDHSQQRAARFEGHGPTEPEAEPLKGVANGEDGSSKNSSAEIQPEIDPKLEQWAQEALEDIDLFEGEGFEKLANARAAVAEASVKSRRGNLAYSRGRREQQLVNAIDDYKQERKAAFDELVAAMDEEIPVANKKAFLAYLASREDGALMGEEANYYLTKEDSWSQRMMEKYKSLPKWGRITAGIGATAVVGLGAGIVGGAAAAGGIIGARVGRGYVNREAKQGKSVRSREEKEQESTLKQSNMDDYISMYQILKSVRSRDESNNFTTTKDKDLLRTVHENSNSRLGQSDEAYIAQMDEAEKERYRKYKSLAWAVGGAAVGALAGSFIENVLDLNGGDVGSETPDVNGGEIDPETPDTDIEGTDGSELDSVLDEREALIEEREGLIDEIEQAEDKVAELEANAAEVTPDVSPELQGLFGELAGEQIEITIPEGSNIWDQLELVVDQEAPGVSFDEKQRLVGNIVERLQQQHPGRDLNLAYPGESFTTLLQ